MRIASATLPLVGAADAAAFHADVLGLAVETTADGHAIAVGDAALELVEAAAGEGPAHHVAYRVAPDRIDAAQAWLAGRAPLLAHEGRERLRWSFWDADAVYALAPGGLVLELIAFDGLPPSGRRGAFDAGELEGLAEVGVAVPDVLAAVRALAPLGVGTWDGPPDPAFTALGARGASLIVVAAPRPWFPTALVATGPPRAIVFSGAGAGTAVLDGGCAVSARAD